VRALPHLALLDHSLVIHREQELADLVAVLAQHAVPLPRVILEPEHPRGVVEAVVRLAAASASTAGLLGDAVHGLREVARHPVARGVGLGLALFVLFAAMENVGRPFLARAELGGGARGVGLLHAAPQAGLLMGFLLVARFGLGRRARAAFLGGMALCAAGSLLTAAAPTLAWAMAAQLASGIGNGLEVAGVDALLPRTVPAALLGRAFANVYGAAHLAAGAAYLAGGPLLDATSPRGLFIVVGAGGLAVAALTAALLPRGPDAPASR
jgi:MFS family permease